ncbi:hypothetical protein M2451_002835 [Dysgonomonas sp. PFB1-18]|uniref:hypothetical protein n=1 Tax=unclassified Dysgonomonas TaxID=2630389 RepID=UPI002476428B|nr:MULTISPECIES: hypothetical protein [unclassified Dysgonomonas]MDH6309944.1 hypothetical protein [Dysgonomonas sp. PF1-14]MDH6339854.1 hypothetical protein [Dysgonomonas sp. PF1-16]MDH6381502.1 hypothetical protein [Dysgonomonas sp. PFB1-18]MDH6398862.1 hypothetical protein [Dysgonomonas sp. PF1-23]
MNKMKEENILNKVDLNITVQALSPAPFQCKIIIDGVVSEGDAYARSAEEAKEKIMQAYGHMFDDIEIECYPKGSDGNQ